MIIACGYYYKTFLNDNEDLSEIINELNIFLDNNKLI